MHKPLLIFLFLLAGFTSAVFAQQRIISGTLTDETGQPLPGVNILVKGTTQGTTSDANGRYSITAPIGSTLVISYIGFTTYEVTVTEGNSQPSGSQRVTNPSAQPARKKYLIHSPEEQEKGVARLSEGSPGFILRSGNRNVVGMPFHYAVPNAYAIRYLSPKWATLRHGRIGKNGLFIVKDRLNPATPLQFTFISAFTIEHAYKLPTLQTQYAQGRPLEGKETWHGPETGEIFSWGPKLGNLEYDGTIYPYDNNGRLVNRGAGKGQQANTYNPYAFFQPGFTLDNSLNVYKSLGETSIDVGLQRKQQQHIVPNSGYFRNNFHLKVNAPLLYQLQTGYSLYYSQAKGDLLQRGANMASIFSGILRTPASFDNANGFDGKQAVEQEKAYRLENGMPRSYSPGQSDNPYGLVNMMPDREQLQTLLSTLNLKYNDWSGFGLNYSLGIEKQWNNNKFGLAPLSAGSPEGRFTDRSDNQTTIHSILTPSFRYEYGYFSLDASSTYDFSFTERTLNRQDYSSFLNKPFPGTSAYFTYLTKVYQYRRQHEWMTSVNLQFKHAINLKLSNQSYFSSTIPKSKAFLPGAGVGFILTNINPLRSSSLLSYGRLFASYAQSLKEAPLLYNKWHIHSTQYSVADYLSYFEGQELPFTSGLQPEQQRKWEYGAAFNLFNYRIGVEFLYFNKLTKNALVPIYQNRQFNLSNAADILTTGFETSLQYQTHIGDVHLNSKLNFTHFKPVVKQVYGTANRLPIAGFREVSNNLVEGQPYGVIYGNIYQRNSEGKVVIGANGFPLVDPELKPIGNPNPDFVAGFDQTLGFRDFALSFVIDIRKGGDVWNGTRNSLDYLGMSQRTEQGREVRNYIFDGVREDGRVNSQPVDFANPANGLSGNRWVHYGMSGVAEDAIEDGSWVRLNEVKFSYRLTRLLSNVLPHSETKLSLIGKNLLLLTHYSGVDPATTLFGYETASGLDFFNMPTTRSYGLSLTIKL